MKTITLRLSDVAYESVKGYPGLIASLRKARLREQQRQLNRGVTATPGTVGRRDPLRSGRL